MTGGSQISGDIFFFSFFYLCIHVIAAVNLDAPTQIVLYAAFYLYSIYICEKRLKSRVLKFSGLNVSHNSIIKRKSYSPAGLSFNKTVWTNS